MDYGTAMDTILGKLVLIERPDGSEFTVQVFEVLVADNGLFRIFGPKSLTGWSRPTRGLMIYLTITEKHTIKNKKNGPWRA